MLNYVNARAFIIWEKSQIMNKRFGKSDLFFLSAILIVCIILAILYLFIFDKAGNLVIVKVDDEIFGQYPLYQDIKVDITDKNGEVTNILEISDGQANMVDANCPDHICVNHKPINLDKQTIVCLPNKVVISIVSDNKSQIDTIAK